MESVRISHGYSKLQSVENEIVSGELICKRITSPYYITTEHMVDFIAGVFNEHSDLQVLGVVNGSGTAVGIITKNDVFSLIGQKFGRELYLGRSITEIIKIVDFIYYKRNTFSVIDEISGDLNSAENRYYILVDSENCCKGIISSFDLVLFLSAMMTKELKAARRVHSAIVKDEINIITEKLAVLGSTQMAGETGGDFQYIKKIGEDRLFISLCDVSGKGLNAGLISVAVSSMYAAYDFDKGILGLIEKINSYIYSLFSGEIFLTGVFIEIKESTGEASIYDMGHSMIYRIKDGKVYNFESHLKNFPLGIQENITPEVSRIKIDSGDIIASYSDGFTEQSNNSNEMFGEQKLLSLISKYRNSGLKQVKDILYEELKKWRFGQAQEDDMSLLLIKFK